MVSSASVLSFLMLFLILDILSLLGLYSVFWMMMWSTISPVSNVDALYSVSMLRWSVVTAIPSSRTNRGKCCCKCSEIDDSVVAASQNIFNTLLLILHSWNSSTEEVVFTFEAIYICRISCLRLYSAISSLHLQTVYLMYSFRYRVLPITTPIWLCPDDVILMLILSNISAVFNSHSSLNKFPTVFVTSSFTILMTAFPATLRSTFPTPIVRKPQEALAY